VRRTARAFECLALFAVLPAVVAASPRLAPGLVGARPPVLPVLGLLALGLAVALARDPGFVARRDLALGWGAGELRRVLGRFVVGGPALVAFALATDPAGVLALPRARPGLALALALVYPVASVLPQELVYRVAFFRRYEALFGPGRALVGASALAFGLAHVVFLDGTAVALTAAGGWCFAATYGRTRSLGLAVLEHSLYGLLAFVLGLGAHFPGGTLAALGAMSPAS